MGQKPLSLKDIEIGKIYWIREIDYEVFWGMCDPWFLGEISRIKGTLIQIKTWNKRHTTEEIWHEFEDIMVMDSTIEDYELLIESMI